jgi:predicted DNA-binding ribbon-helix-helix protein
MLNWLMGLPDSLEDVFWLEIRQYEEARNMAYVTSVERIGFKRGVKEGLSKGKREGLLDWWQGAPAAPGHPAN